MSAPNTASRAVARTSRTSSVPSSSTLLFGLVGIAAVIALAILGWTEVLGEDLTLIVSDLGNVVIHASAAIVIIKVALSFGRGESVSNQWLLLGLGVAAFAVGDAIWAYVELVAKTDPYPSLADVGYFAEYGFFLAGMTIAALSYRKLVDVKRPFAISVVVAFVATAAIYILILQPYILPAGPDELEPMAKLVSIAYPVCDALFMIGPAVFLGLVVSRLGRGRLSWPWWIVVAGVVLYAFGDSWYSLADWAGTYDTYFAFIDSGWLLGNVLIMVAVLVARDVYKS